MRPSLLSRITRSIQAFQSAPNLDVASRRIDAIITKHATPEEMALDVVEKQAKGASRLKVRDTDHYLAGAYTAAYGFLRSWYSSHQKKIPPYGYPDRDEYLSNFWMDEPILAGAIYSMTAKMEALKWMVTGRRLVARQAARLFAQAAHMGGYDWGGFISSTASDFYTTDRGVFWETAREDTGAGSVVNRLAGKLVEVGHIDSLNCTLTGYSSIPMIYVSDTVGQTVYFKPGQFVHFASMPNPRERHLGYGYCAVSRSYRAAKLLMGLHDYDEEKLSNLPPEGVASVTGLTVDEFQDAMMLWKAKREQDKSLTFPQVLWLISQNPGAEVGVSFTGFSQIPESFERKSVIDQYVATLALGFGVDAREFWPVSSGALGTASESEIQHMKARGKGPGEFISIVERHLNAELPEDANFQFDTQDIQEDQVAASVTKTWIDAYWPLFQGIPNPKVSKPPETGGSGLPSTPGNQAGQRTAQPAGQRPPATPTPAIMKQLEEQSQNGNGSEEPQTLQVLDKKQFMRLLADKGVLPEYLLSDERVSVEDSEVHISKEGHPEDFTKFIYKNGVLEEVRLPPIVINTPRQPQVPVAELAEKGADEKKGKGKLFIKAGLLSNANGNKPKPMVVADEDEEAVEAPIKGKIVGNPIPDKEAERGASVTNTTIRNELERWRNHPVLSKYAPTLEEQKKLLRAKQVEIVVKHLPGQHDQKTHTPKGYGKGEAMAMANPAGKDTMSQYRNPDGSWTKERQALHDEIKRKFFEGKTPVDNPTSYILGGGPASGKSTLVGSGLIDLPENMVLAAGDDIKTMLPEYKSHGKNSAPFVHEESSYLSKQIAADAASRGYNLLMDGTGDSSMQQLERKIKSMATKGQNVKGIYVTVDVETAVARSISRAKKTGRYMPESVLRENHAAVSRVFPELVRSGLLSNLDLYDTSSGAPVLVASALGKALTIHNDAMYQTFLDKGG